jgi:predicted helicase
MYAQTISYGLLAARVSRPMGVTADTIVDMVPNNNPFLKEMLNVFLKVGGRKGGIDFDELGVQDVVDLLKATNMEAVLRDFGNRTQREDPVIHFYQDFLQEYDSQRRIKRGVFYTPQPVVSYIIRSAHELLQTEFGLEDGLASTITWGEMIRKMPGLKLPILEPRDPDVPDSKDITISNDEPVVTILDPATGTSTFLVEVIDIIYKTMTVKWAEEGLKPQQITQKWNEYVPNHLLPRLYGFELMMAPYAIAHMKIGLKLNATGY